MAAGTRPGSGSKFPAVSPDAARYTEGALTRRTPSRLHLIAPALALAGLAANGNAASSKKTSEPTTPWRVAEAARAQLAQIPPGERTQTDYRTVMDAYRLIYHANPGDLHSPEAILAVGNLLAEEGVVLHDPHAFQAALGQYDFLRRQYPTSSLRITAALEEAHVAAAGMHDPKLAREKYTNFVTEFPHSQRVPEAREALQDLKAGRLPTVRSGPWAGPDATAQASGQNAASTSPGTTPPTGTEQTATTKSSTLTASQVPSPARTQPLPAMQNASRLQTEAAANSNGVAQSTVAPGERAEASQRASERTATPHDQVVHAATNPEQAATDDTPAAAKAAAHAKNGLAQVTGIRHWSTPTYTRVAIDLGDEVTYEAARVPHPDRIYFDLHGTRLAPELQGKLLNVVDDGFLKRVRIAQYTADSTRVVLDVNDVTEYSAFLLPNPYRLIIDIHGGTRQSSVVASASGTSSTKADVPVRTDRSAADGQVVGDAPSATAAIAAEHHAGPLTPAMKANLDVAALSRQPGRVEATAQPTTHPIAVVADRSGESTEIPATAHKVKHALAGANSGPVGEPPADVSVQRTATPTADGQRSLMRALGLKIGRIVIDPGHGGHDSGTLGADGIMEKDVVLDVALRLGKLLHDHLGAEIIYTRSDDTFIPLETRTAIANKAQADLFLSIHANSSKDESARGVETYYLNFTSDPTALDVAARENAVSDQSVSELSTMVKKITLKDKIDESREFAQDVEQTLYAGLEKGNAGLKNRGVKKAPFVVLIGANMPSILTEISFVTNPDDAAKLRTGEYRERVAESIYKGVARYTQGLGGMRVASASGKPGKTTE